MCFINFASTQYKYAQTFRVTLTLVVTNALCCRSFFFVICHFSATHGCVTHLYIYIYIYLYRCRKIFVELYSCVNETCMSAFLLEHRFPYFDCNSINIIAPFKMVFTLTYFSDWIKIERKCNAFTTNSK